MCVIIVPEMMKILGIWISNK